MVEVSELCRIALLIKKHGVAVRARASEDDINSAASAQIVCISSVNLPILHRSSARLLIEGRPVDQRLVRWRLEGVGGGV